MIVPIVTGIAYPIWIFCSNPCVITPAPLVNAMANSELATAMCDGMPSNIMVVVSVIPPPNPTKPVTRPLSKLLITIKPGLRILYSNTWFMESLTVLFHPLGATSGSLHGEAVFFLKERNISKERDRIKSPHIPINRFLGRMVVRYAPMTTPGRSNTSYSRASL